MTAPLLSVVRGEPTAEQLAALVAVVAARVGAGADAEPAHRSLWSVPSLRAPMTAGRDGWRASALPR